MTKFKHKNGGIAEVFTKVNIARLQNDPDYVELVNEATPKKEKKSPKKVQEIVQEEEVEQIEPLR